MVRRYTGHTLFNEGNNLTYWIVMNVIKPLFKNNDKTITVCNINITGFVMKLL